MLQANQQQQDLSQQLQQLPQLPQQPQQQQPQFAQQVELVWGALWADNVIGEGAETSPRGRRSPGQTHP